jgi:hypothetical protein
MIREMSEYRGAQVVSPGKLKMIEKLRLSPPAGRTHPLKLPVTRGNFVA